MSDDKKKEYDPADLIQAIQKDGLMEYLQDADMAEILIDLIAEETGVRKILIRLVIKLLIPWVAKLAKKAGKTLADLGFGKIQKKIVSSLPFYQKIDDAFRKLKGKLDTDSDRKKVLADILKGVRPVRDYEEIKGFSQELQVMLTNLGTLSDIITLLKPQPPLEPKILPQTESNRLVYSAQSLPFQARQKELAGLQEFLGNEKKFTWWLAVGPGGAGKSRLALELCLRNCIQWRAGFLPENQMGFNWHDWEPERPTLIIVDYALYRAEDLGKMLSALRSREDTKPLDWPVRVLLLERSAENLLDRMGTGSTKASIEASQYKEPLKLENLSPEDLWAIMLSKHNSLKDKAETLNDLHSLDPEGRPLFAIMSADALASGENIRRWDKKQLLDYILKREEERWKFAVVTEQDKNLLAFATMVKGVALEKPEPIGLQDYLPKKMEYHLTQERFGQTGADTIAPLEPDIVGEYFVLNRLTKYQHVNMAGVYRKAAWKYDHLGIFSFLNLAARDFPEDKILHVLLAIPDDTPVGRLGWAILVINFIAYAKIESLNTSQEFYDKLSILASNHEDEPEFRSCQAKGAYNLIRAYHEAGNLLAARKIYDNLTFLAGKHNNEPELRNCQAKGAYNLIIYYCKSKNTDKAQTIYDNLSSLASKYENELELRSYQAKGAYNLIINYCKAGNLIETRRIYNDLSTLANKYQNESELRIQRAMGAFNLITAYGNAGNLTESRAIFDKLVELASKYEGEPELRSLQAQGAVNLINDYGKAVNPTEARAMFDKLVELASKCEGEPELRSLQAQGAVNLIFAYGKINNVEAQREIAKSNFGVLKSEEFRLFMVDNIGEEKAEKFLPLIDHLVSGAE